jgi:anti-anti-sigma factor
VLRAPLAAASSLRQFWIDVSWAGGTATVAAHGRLDAVAAPELSVRLAEIIEVTRPRRLVIDLADARHIDRAGALAVVGASARLTGGGAQLVIRFIPHAALPFFAEAGLGPAAGGESLTA